MKPFALCLLLLAACATAPAAKPQRWPASLTYTVVHACGKARLGDLKQCGCFAEQLERVSPSPTTKATDAEIDTAMAACGIEKAESEPEETNL